MGVGFFFFFFFFFGGGGGQVRCERRSKIFEKIKNQRTNGPVNAHLISCPSKAQNIQNLENIWFKKCP